MLKHAKSKEKKILFLEFLKLPLSRSEYRDLGGIPIISMVKLDIKL